MARKIIPVLALFLLVPLLVAQERVDLNMIHRLKTAEFENSKVMEIMYNLTDRYGPRLTNSPQFRAAGNWAVGQLKEWGLANVHLEKWATPAENPIPSWQYTQYSGAMVEPGYMPIIGVPVAWTGGTNGPVTGEAVLAPIQTVADLDKYKGKLAGKIVLTADPLELVFPTEPLGHRYTDAELSALAIEPVPSGPDGDRFGRSGASYIGRNVSQTGQPRMDYRARRELRRRLDAFWKEEKVLLVLQASARGESGTLMGGGAENRMDTTNPPQVSITAEHYNHIARLLQHKVPVKLRFDIKTEWDTSNTESFNIIGEIPGKTKPDEVVMVGGHFDSWHYATGATDNAAGSGVAMEVVRLLEAVHANMDRTVRIALWGGEEEGEYGSKAYVKLHFADPTVMKPTAEHAKLSGYFNIDNGTGKIRGVYLQGNEMMRPIFESWFAALKDLTPGVVTIRNTGQTDHESFDAVGLPGFQFIQDPMDYETRSHHTNMDVYDRLQPADLRQMAVIEASFAYNAATRPDVLPRKDLPAPQPEDGRGGRGGRSSGN